MSVPRALELAREARLAGDSSVAAPSVLWEAATRILDDGRSRDDVRELYRHALIEAGHIVRRDLTLYDPCPQCGWSPDRGRRA